MNFPESHVRSIIADIVLTNENEDRGYIFSEFSEEFEDETPGEIFRAP
jgi:hypothetical protein